MKRQVIGAASVLLIGTLVVAQAPPAARQPNYIDSTYGFSFASPAFPQAGAGQPAVPVIVAGPTVDGFASNVNVNIQQLATTRQGYIDLSLGQLRQLGFKINSTTEVTVSGKEGVRFDYEGKLGGRELHCLALAVVEKERVVLVTCTAQATAYQAIEPEFRACLDSFRLK